MTDPIDNSGVVAALRRQMTMAAAKELAAASNLANLNTPGFRAEEPVFSEELDGALNLPLATSSAGHLQADGSTDEVITGRRPVASLSARRDGNTVQLDRELMSMMTAAGEFKAAQTALSAKFRLVRYAITEGR
ncbi:MAG TPA: flagellar basal body protein [Vicinamibacterales bacterium]|nr:flagellar basal body protein [Vicinamibacterales bacterium]